MYCSKCGNKVEEGRSECPYCGFRLVQAVPQFSETQAQSTGAVVQPAGIDVTHPLTAAENVREAAASTQNIASGSSHQSEHLPQSQQELKEYLTQLAQAESVPASASAVNHLVKSGFSTGAVVKFYGAG